MGGAVPSLPSLLGRTFSEGISAVYLAYLDGFEWGSAPRASLGAFPSFLGTRCSINKYVIWKTLLCSLGPT